MGHRQRGFTYLGVLILLAVISVGIAATAELWATAQQRERETQLLFVGHQFRAAIGRYYEQSPAGARRYPTRLEDLLKDPRHPNIRRHLRQIYLDPITGSRDWGLVKNAAGEVIGVKSLSEAEPLKKAHFALADAGFEGRKKYSDWQFVHQPAQTAAASGRRR